MIDEIGYKWKRKMDKEKRIGKGASGRTDKMWQAREDGKEKNAG